MYESQTKKEVIIYILKILEKYSDENHRLKQNDILNYLQSEFLTTVDRKCIKKNLLTLEDLNYGINYDIEYRTDKNGKEQEIYTNFYITRTFTDGELRLIIDSLLFSNTISHRHKVDIIQNLENLSNKYFKYKVKHKHSLGLTTHGNKEIFYIIETLNNAIVNKKKVKFFYNNIGTDKKMHPRTKDGVIREYIVNPYQMAVVNGHYYLICNYDKYNNVDNYRIDRISNIEMLNETAKPIKETENGNYLLDLPKYISQKVYMFSGKSATVEFVANKSILNEIFDWFGYDIKFYDETETQVKVRAYVNLTAMRKWALQYALCAKVLSPQSLVEEVKEDIKNALTYYEYT